MERKANPISPANRKDQGRFSSRQDYAFKRNKSITGTAGKWTAPIVSDENMPCSESFTHVHFASSENQPEQAPLSTSQLINTRLTISPGTKATANKRDAKLQKLQEMRRQRELAKARKSVPPRALPKIELAATERSFLESSSRELPKLPGNQLAYPVPEPRFSDISSIQPGDATYVVSTKTPHKISRSVACSTPLRYNRAVMEVPPSAMKTVPEEEPVSKAGLHPATAMVLTCDEDYFMSRDERTERQFEAMSVWCNMILRSQYDDEEVDIGATKKEANKVLQDLLVKTKAQMSSSVTVDKPFKYSDFLKRQKRDNTRERAMRLFNSTNVPERIRDAVDCRLFSVRAGCNVYSDLSLQTTLLRLFLSFHPAWLHLGLETVFHTSIDVNENEKFIHVISRFIIQRVFADPKILRNQNYAYGSHKRMLNEKGKEAVNSHFLVQTALFCYFVETAKAASIIKHNPRMFTKNSAFKCLDDVFAELSREVLSGGGVSLKRAFAKIGFKPTYKQSFVDDYCYLVKSSADLADGVIMGKLVELVTDCKPGYIMDRLRNPCGDRLRKIGNVKTCLQVAVEKGVDIGGIKAESVVAGSRETILEMLWKLVGVYVSVGDERKLRRALLVLSRTGNGLTSRDGDSSANVQGEQLVLLLCQQIGCLLGVQVDQLDDLRDGRVLSGAWRIFNVHAPDIRLYPGDSLFLKCVNAAASELDVPWGLHKSIGLFTVHYLSSLFSIREIHDAAICIQRAYRSYKFFKTLTKLLQQTRDDAPTSEVDNRSSLMKTYVLAPIAGDKAETTKLNSSREDAIRTVLGEVREKIELGKQLTDLQKEEHAKEVIFADSAIKIQPAFRRHLYRVQGQAERQRRLSELTRAATVVQRAFRRHQSRVHERAERQRRLLEITRAATVVQRAFRRHQSRVQGRAERQTRLTELTRAATVIQQAFRRHQSRVHERAERQRRLLEITRAATVVQRAFRRHQSRLQARAERQRKLLELTRAAAVIQWGQGRSERQRRLLEITRATTVIQQEAEFVVEETCGCGPSTSNNHTEDEKRVDIARVLELQRNIRENERLQKICSNILEACERKLSEEDSCEGDPSGEFIDGQVTTARCSDSFTNRTSAAVKIQAWYRGCRERSGLQKHIAERRSFMIAYRGNVAAEEPSDVVDNVALSSQPVHEKIHAAIEMLFDPKMYVSKVGAFILNRLSALSPHLCAYLVIDAQGLSALLDFFEQKTTGRGPAATEILTILQEVFLRLIECPYPSVSAEVDANVADCVKVSLHMFHAFYVNPVIVCGFGRAILALYRRPNAKPHFDKASFYLNYATKRFARLPITDPRKILLSEMRSEMLFE
nr:IQ calmodulin-binding region domain containing protein [Haemonchus contortus]